jgi:pSer/pThr/pTyr-binding forkhead associated (FHA) protein
MRTYHNEGESVMPFLCQIRRDRSAVERWEIGDKPVVVGRGERADVRIQDERLSREHFAGLREDGVFVVYDLNSTNGTWVRGQRIARLELRPGDQIRAGRIFFLFEAGLATAAQELGNGRGCATEVMA